MFLPPESVMCATVRRVFKVGVASKHAEGIVVGRPKLYPFTL